MNIFIAVLCWNNKETLSQFLGWVNLVFSAINFALFLQTIT